MIGVIATIKVQPGKTDAFEALFREMTAHVKAQEPDTLLYQLTRVRTAPDTYKVLEIYASENAMATHGASTYGRALGPRFAEVLAAPLELEHLDGVI